MESFTQRSRSSRILTEQQNFSNEQEQPPNAPRTKIAKITESMHKDLAYSHTNVERKQVFATNDGITMLSKKANQSTQKSAASSVVKSKVDNKTSFAVMNSYSTASLP